MHILMCSPKGDQYSKNLYVGFVAAWIFLLKSEEVYQGIDFIA